MGNYLPYEPAIHVPVIVSGPAVDESLRGTESDLAVANVDLAPTILDLAGIEPRSLPDAVPSRRCQRGSRCPGRPGSGGTSIRVPSTRWASPSLPGSVPFTHNGVRSSDGWVYVRWEDLRRAVEPFDLSTEPNEVDNVAQDPARRRPRAPRKPAAPARALRPPYDVPPYAYLDLCPGRLVPSWFEVAHWADAARVGIALTDGTFAPNDAGRRGALLAWLWRHGLTRGNAVDGLHGRGSGPASGGGLGDRHRHGVGEQGPVPSAAGGDPGDLGPVAPCRGRAAGPEATPWRRDVSASHWAWRRSFGSSRIRPAPRDRSPSGSATGRYAPRR